MGSGTNRKWWKDVAGTRTTRKFGTKSWMRTNKNKALKQGHAKKMKGLRAEAARRSNPA